MRVLSHTKAVCAALADAGYEPVDWVEVLKGMARPDLRTYIADVNENYTPDGVRKRASSPQPSAPKDEGPTPDQEAIAALKKVRPARCWPPPRADLTWSVLAGGGRR